MRPYKGPQENWSFIQEGLGEELESAKDVEEINADLQWILDSDLASVPDKLKVANSRLHQSLELLGKNSKEKLSNKLGLVLRKLKGDLDTEEYHLFYEGDEDPDQQSLDWFISFETEVKNFIDIFFEKDLSLLADILRKDLKLEDLHYKGRLWSLISNLRPELIKSPLFDVFLYFCETLIKEKILDNKNPWGGDASHIVWLIASASPGFKTGEFNKDEFFYRLGPLLNASLIKLIDQDSLAEVVRLRQTLESIGIEVKLDITGKVFDRVRQGKLDQNAISFIKEKAEKERLEEIVQGLKKIAKEIGLHVTNQQNIDPDEWGVVKDFFFNEKGELHKPDTEEVKKIREVVLQPWVMKGDSVVVDGFDVLMYYLGNSSGKDQLIWDYLKDSRKHDSLMYVPSFINCVKEVESEDGRSRRDVVTSMLHHAGMGTGMQADIFRDIMFRINAEVWKKLETESLYENKSPCLSDPNSVNLLRIKNEIRLVQMPELKEAVSSIPPEKESLRSYVLELFSNPAIDLEALKNFISEPGAFFSSTSGAGEQNLFVSLILREMHPDYLVGWSAKESRDAIVEGTYDRVNVFKPIVVEWYDSQNLEEQELLLNKILRQLQQSDNGSEIIPSALGYVDQIMDLAGEKKVQAMHGVVDRAVGINLWVEFICNKNNLKESWNFLLGKGKKLADKAFDYKKSHLNSELKQREKKIKKDIEGLEKRIEKTDASGKSSLDESLRSLKLKLEEILKAIQKNERLVEDEAGEFYSNLDIKVGDEAVVAQQQETIRWFWESLYKTGFKVNVLHLTKQITGHALSGEDELRKICFQNALNGGAETKKRIKNCLEEIMMGAKNILSLCYYRAEILKPSDPRVATAGTATGTCDAFGSGKKGHFMTNPNCAQFVLYRSKEERPEKWDVDHLVAQSTLIQEVDVFNTPQERWDFYQGLRINNGKIGETLKQINYPGGTKEFLRKLDNVRPGITLDSVEVPGGAQAMFNPMVIFGFLQESFKRMAMVEADYRRRLIIGKNFSYLKDIPEQVKNRGAWETPIAYSDNFGLDKHQEDAVFLGDYSQDVDQSSKPVSTFVRPARPIDALRIACVEDVAFSRSGGEAYITGVIPMSKNVFASSLHSEHYNTAPLAYIQEGFDNSGKKHTYGYLVALPQEDGSIYIDDTATTGEIKGTGSSLLISFLSGMRSDQKYKGAAIRMSCRAFTSARAIAKEPNRKIIEEQLGYIVEGPSFEEVSKYTEDSLIPYTFRPKL